MKKILDGMRPTVWSRRYFIIRIIQLCQKQWNVGMRICFVYCFQESIRSFCAINEKYCQKLSVYYSKEEEKIAQMAVIGNNEIRMANLCVALCRRINGVSNLHADILKTRILKDLIRSFHKKISCDHKWDHTQTLVSTGQSGAISSGKRVCERGYFKGLPSV